MTGQRLQKELEQRDLRPSVFAECVMGTSRSNVSRWLSGTRPIPEQEVLTALRMWDRRALREYHREMREAAKSLKKARRYIVSAAGAQNSTKPTAPTAGFGETIVPSLQREASP